MMASQSQPTPATLDDSVDHPATAPVPSNAAQRQSAYRQRRKRAIIEAIGNEAAASRATLLALLAHELAALDAHTAPPTTIAPARNTARRVLSEIITRYAIEL
jgi:hypothetical protein